MGIMRAAEEEEREWEGINRWSELPTPDELMPLSQSLITPDLALAFDIPTTHHPSPPPPPPAAIDGVEEPARTLKRPRLVWTPQLHKRFVDAVAHLGIKNAVPKTIMQLMSVDGLTRENVASHLQKYRLYLKRMQGLGSSSSTSASDLAADRLFASSPVPHHFLARSTPDPHFAPYQQYYPQLGQFRGFDHPFVPRAPQMHRVAMPMVSQPPPPPIPYSEELDSGAGGARKVLTLFPTGED